ncbi:hypothetical protein YC2023_018236 [Brassica napus]
MEIDIREYEERVCCAMLHGNGSGYVEAKENILEARFRKLPQVSDSDFGSEAESGRPMKLRAT